MRVRLFVYVPPLSVSRDQGNLKVGICCGGHLAIMYAR